MSRIIILVVFVLNFNWAFAQLELTHSIYTKAALVYGNYNGYDLNLYYAYKEKWSFNLGYTFVLRSPISQPQDFKHEISRIFSHLAHEPSDIFKNFQLGVGQIFKLNEDGTIRLNVLIGLGYTIISEPSNWKRVMNSFLARNYTWQNRSIHTVSLIFNPSIEFPFSRFLGLTITPKIMINKERMYIGIGIGKMLGILRKKGS